MDINEYKYINLSLYIIISLTSRRDFESLFCDWFITRCFFKRRSEMFYEDENLLHPKFLAFRVCVTDEFNSLVENCHCVESCDNS